MKAYKVNILSIPLWTDNKLVFYVLREQSLSLDTVYFAALISIHYLITLKITYIIARITIQTKWNGTENDNNNYNDNKDIYEKIVLSRYM